MKVGLRLGCADCPTEIIVVQAPSGDVALRCGGSSLTDLDAARQGNGHDGSDGESVLLGKRYTDGEVGLEVLCTNAGIGPLSCDGRPLSMKVAKPLPSSD